MTEIILTTAKNHRYMGAHHPKQPDLIWLHPGEIWEWAAKHTPPRATQDEIEEWFIKKLDAVFLQELVCIFKGQDKLRIKGGACNPYCRHEFLVDLMITPDEWVEIKAFHKIKRKTYTEDS